MKLRTNHSAYKLASSVIFAFIFAFAGAQNANHWETIVRSYDIWNYIVPVSEPPAEWNTEGFDDSSWLKGKGNIGYGEVDDSTILTGNQIYSLYMRINFNVTDKNVISDAMLHVDYDDGFVAYLNGHEIARANLGTPGDRPPFNAFALTSHEALMPSGGIPTAFPINPDTLSKYIVSGNNVLALQVHNIQLSSSDLSSTTFFSVGITSSSTYYYPLPYWFPVTMGTTSKLPIIAIDTYGQIIPDGTKIMAACKVINNNEGKINDLNDPGTDYDGPIGIELRGQSSQMFPKKPYSVEIRKSPTVNATAALLGMPANKDWVLYAPYSDKTMLRNVVSFYLGNKLGSWQPRCRYCVLYLNGEYLGIYVLMESIHKGPGRVDISRLGFQETTGDELTGGYIVKVDKIWDLTPDEYFTTTPGFRFPNTMNYTFTYVYPKIDSINSAQKIYIKSFLTQAETVLNSPQFLDPVNGIQSFFDYGSFADYQIIQELSNNVDGYRLSQYFYKKKITRGNKLFAGPLWDIDLGYANATYYDYNYVTTGWLYPHYAPDWEHPMHWWARLMEDPVYVRRFVNKWREMRRGAFMTDSVMHFIDSTTAYLGEEINKNYQRWPILGTWIWPNYYVGTTYEDEINFLKGWISDRMAWMDSATGLNSDLYKEAFSTDGVIVYPVPVSDRITIAFSLDKAEEVRFEFTDLFGRKFREYRYIPPAEGSQEVIIDMGEFKTGYFILRIRQGSRIIANKKVVKY